VAIDKDPKKAIPQDEKPCPTHKSSSKSRRGMELRRCERGIHRWWTGSWTRFGGRPPGGTARTTPSLPHPARQHHGSSSRIWGWGKMGARHQSAAEPGRTAPTKRRPRMPCGGRRTAARRKKGEESAQFRIRERRGREEGEPGINSGPGYCWRR